MINIHQNIFFTYLNSTANSIQNQAAILLLKLFIYNIYNKNYNRKKDLHNLLI